MATIRVEWFNPADDYCEKPAAEVVMHKDSRVSNLVGLLGITNGDRTEETYYSLDRVARVTIVGDQD